MNRRDFLNTSLVAGASLGLLPRQASAAQEHPNQQVVFCAFSDIHYMPGVFPHDSVEWLDQILDRAARNHADLVIHCGDMVHAPQKCLDYLNHYNDFKIPTCHTLGNHDTDGNSYEKTLEAYRLANGYYFFDKRGFRFIVMDTNYCGKYDALVHYSEGNNYKTPGAYVPPAELEWLKATLDSSPFPCIVTSHHSFERERGGCSNWPQVRAIFNAANEKHSGRVRLVINGHYHHDNLRLLDNIVYLDLNSANYEWVPKAHDKYPQEVLKAHRLAKNTVIYNDPISAIITMDTSGHLKIDGQKSQLFMGITREQTGNEKFDSSGRLCTANIQSINLKLEY